MRKTTIGIVLMAFLIVFSDLLQGQNATETVLHRQDTITTYYDQCWKECAETRALYYKKKYVDSSGIWIVKDYHINGQLKMSGTYSGVDTNEKNGSAVLYYFDGSVSDSGQYKNNKKVGLWKAFYRGGGLESVGKMSDDMSDSIWTYYHRDGSVFGVMNYVSGKAEGESKWYYPSGKLSEWVTYRRGKIKRKVNYDVYGTVIKEKGKDSDAELLKTSAQIRSFLLDNLNYPQEMSSEKKEGFVLLNFIVRKNGKIDDIQIRRADHPLFNQEALRVLHLINFMYPIQFHGQFMDYEYTLPINFKLNPR